VAHVEWPKPESELSLLRLLMASMAMLSLVYATALLVVFEFVYRHLIAAPIAWLLSRIGRLNAACAAKRLLINGGEGAASISTAGRLARR
jgi:hypothetical protein